MTIKYSMIKKIDPKVAASILAFDFGNLAFEVKKIQEAKADAIHIDIMDGHFVPNLTMGPKIVRSIRRATDLFLDVHLMMYNPFDYVEKFCEAGADGITFHVEATENVKDVIAYIRKCNKKVGLSLNPETSFSMIEPYVFLCDLILVMAVHPGFGGQAFIPEVLEKISFLSQMKKKHDFSIQVDGGINIQTARQCLANGADFLVSGSFLFEQDNLKQAINSLKTCGQVRE